MVSGRSDQAMAVRLRTIVETWWWRILILAPAALSISCLNRSGTYRALIFDGGWIAQTYVVSWLVLTPYLGWVVIATGRLTYALIRHEAARRVDEFFLGAAVLILIGLGLGAMSILYPQLVLGLMAAVLLWDTRSLRTPRRIEINYAALAMLLLGVWLLGAVFLDRAVIPDVISTDVQQLYAPYLAEVARNHSVWLAADNPIFSDFEIGHGNGLHLLLATFLPPHVAQIISFLYFVGIGAVIFELIRTLMPLRAFGPGWDQAAIPMALGVAILGLAWDSGLHVMEFGKYHLQTAAFCFYFLLVVMRSCKGRDRLAAGICAFAFALTYPLYAVFAFLIAGLGVLAKALQRDRSGIAMGLTLGLGAAGGCIVAFASNYVYLGIPATNPYSIFRHVVSIDRFSQFGSLDILDYFVLAQSVGVSDFSIGSGLMAATRQVKTVFEAAAFLVMIFCVVSFADSKLLPGRSSALRTPSSGMAAGLFILLAYLISVRLLDATLQIPSLMRLSFHVKALIPVASVAVAFGGLTVASRLAPSCFTGRLAPHIAVLTLFLVCAWAIRAYPWRSFSADGAMLFVEGRPLDQMPRVSADWRRCDELQQSTGSDRILALNGYRAMVPCYFSPLLTRGKVIHTYQSDVARDFRMIALGTADTAEAALRSLGVKLFYVQKQNCDFWLNGFSDLFQKAELERRFAVHSETPHYWLLTWKDGDQTLSPQVEAGISALRTRSKDIYREAYGTEPFEVVKHRSTLAGKRGDITALAQLSTCH